MKKQFRLTQEGVDELKHEHADLVAQRTEVAERIRLARDMGDLAENAEYQAAREEQDRLEARISELEKVLRNVQIIKKPKTHREVVLGSIVKLKSTSGKAQQFSVVGTMEADPQRGKISDESPLGKMLLGRKVGDKVLLKNSPNTAYKITNIS
jgi:transcription elongation factor GreA